jgi:hypothetical protein
MKNVKSYILIFIAGCLFSCNKSGSSSTPSSTMSATVGGNPITFSASFNNTNGIIAMTGSSNTTSVTLYLKLSGGGGTYNLGDPSTSYYATTSYNLATYSTSGTNYIGQAVVSQGSNGLYSGSFYFNAIETSPTNGGNSVSVTNGAFSNM